MSDEVAVSDDHKFVARSIPLWIVRFLFTAALMAGWLVAVVLFLALILPEPPRKAFEVVGATLDGRSEGVFANLQLNVLLGTLTAVFYLTILPMMLLPMKEADRFVWFLFTAYGWMTSLLGAVGLLRRTGHLQVIDPALPLGFWGFQLLLAGILLGPILLVFLPGVDPKRRAPCAIALGIGWLMIQGGSLGYAAINGEWSQHVDGTAKEIDGIRFFLLANSILYVILATSLVLPSDRRARLELTSFLLLLWLFGLAGVLCYQVIRQEAHIVGDAGPLVFRSLAVTAFAAPFISWLGMPWARNGRLGWVACFIAAAAVVLGAAFFAPFPSSPREWSSNIFQHIYRFYDGPHIIRDTSSF